MLNKHRLLAVKYYTRVSFYHRIEQQFGTRFCARTSVSARMNISIAPNAVSSSSWCRSNYSRRRSRASRLLCSSSFTSNRGGDDDDDDDDNDGGKDNNVKGLSAIKRTNTNVDEDAVLSNIGDSTSQKRKADEFAQMLNAAKKYSESKKMGVETPSVQGGGIRRSSPRKRGSRRREGTRRRRRKRCPRRRIKMHQRRKRNHRRRDRKNP